ncbi:MAG TPA: gluconeogenesis factor YvcK family protein [Candidatus Nanoarchaeia archaeon]|nr:gluconeogenesis factor YvcK family protein [Candidatus Nanoarchaeia archaeon]
MPNIVTIGGGSGQHGILIGLLGFAKKHSDKLRQEDITAIVTTFDTGGHTKMLLDARKPKDVKGNFLPPGDIRQCLAAMANNEDAKKLFELRLKEGYNENSSWGNNFLDGAYELFNNNFEKAINMAKKFLDVKGNVLPCTLTRAEFSGVLKNGYEVKGEEDLVEKSVWFNSPIKSIAIKPANIKANEKAVKAILEADIIVLSQGSLYTSLLPNILVPGIAQAIRKSEAKKVYVMNIVTQRGETDGFTAQDHIDVIEDHLGKEVIDKILIHEGDISDSMKKKYESEGQELVVDNLVDRRAVRTRLIADDSPVLRHDPQKVAEIIMKSK